ncbi:hypothetical protein CSPX01_14632 [Colletotrichum filicis]|nr:hypothetical protein CSPX01_14632 [Colletotrichum filicis]
MAEADRRGRSEMPRPKTKRRVPRVSSFCHRNPMSRLQATCCLQRQTGASQARYRHHCAPYLHMSEKPACCHAHVFSSCTHIPQLKRYETVPSRRRTRPQRRPTLKLREQERSKGPGEAE